MKTFFFGPDINRLEKQRSIEGLMDGLNHWRRTVRKNTADAIARIADESAIPYLRLLYNISKPEGEDFARNLILCILQRFVDNKLIDLLIRVVEEVNDIEYIQQQAFTLLLDYADEAQKTTLCRHIVERHLSECQRNHYYSHSILLKSVQLLGEQRDKDAVNLLTNLAFRDFPDDAGKALYNIIDSQAENYFTTIIEKLDRSKYTTAIPALAAIGTPRAVQHLIRLLEDSEFSTITAEALGRHGRKEALPALRELLSRLPGTYTSQEATGRFYGGDFSLPEMITVEYEYADHQTVREVISRLESM